MKIFFLFICAILFTALHANLTEYLIDAKKYPSSVILMYRGLLGFILCFLLAKANKQSPFPSNWKIQGVRLINSGLILLAIFESYKHLSATTVSLMQRMDIPLIILLALFYNEKKSFFQKLLSVITIITTIAFVYFELLTEEHESSLNTSDWTGFLLISFAAILLAINSRLIKQSVETDNAFIITIITCISTSFFGFSSTLITGKSFYFNPSDTWLLVILTSLLILSYYFLVELYKYYTAEKVQFTSVLAIIATMIFEMIFEKRIFPIFEIIAVCIITFLTYLVATDGKKLKTLLTMSYVKKVFSSKIEL